VVTVWSSGKSHDSHPLAVLVWFFTLRLETVTGQFSLSNREASKYFLVGGEMREEETKSIACAGWRSLGHQKELTPNSRLTLLTVVHLPFLQLLPFIIDKDFFFFHAWLSKQLESCRGLLLALLFIPTIFQRNISSEKLS